MSDPVRVERKGPVTTVIINRPEARNAVTARRPPRYTRRSRNSTATTARRWPCCGATAEPSAREPI